ncbi:hypothetical protein OV079_07775 [Nannocystis pusilla]|uniref:Uncharacterized protein n=1 Tax=Nannocystis pusilla TaxID=889268 RepID=A0A9X3IVK4_9BACT|nr:hypothetical protein [Nannocystis pusilla]MCY1005471.1 hypothetical protein [Nannocystis pusilla]
MIQRKYFPNEHELCTWNAVTLTSHRVIFGDRTTGTSTSLLLHCLSGTEVVKRDEPSLLILAVVALVVAAYADKFQLGALAVVVLVLIYSATRRAKLVIRGNGGEIVRTVTGGDADARAALEFADRIDRVACLVSRKPEAEPLLSSEAASMRQ